MPFDTIDPSITEYDLAKLKAARQLISHPCQWMKFDYSTRENDKFCANGAIRRALKDVPKGKTWVQAYERLLERLECQVHRTMTLVQFNDLSTTTHADILELFDSAIAKLEIVTS